MAKSPTLPSSTDRVLRIVREYYHEAEAARRDRMALNKRNWDLYYGRQDWSHKQEGQSTEFLPKLSQAADQMAAVVKRALIQFGDWFSVEVPRNSPLTPEQVRALLRRYLEKVVVARDQTDNFATVMSGAVKQALMESLLILKVHGAYTKQRRFVVEPGIPLAGIADKLVPTDVSYWRLRIDIVPTNDYYPDPTGRNLYRIHEVERDLADVWELAEQGLYDKRVVAKVQEDMERANDQKKTERARNQRDTTPPSFRKRCVVRECWGTLLGPDGRPLEGQTNIVTTILNDKYVIREPEANPFWHGEDPFVARPMVQVPDSVWSKALLDDAAGLNVALNELYNLILDGGIAAVWGVRQVRKHWLEDPRQISNGIPQNATLLVNEECPADGKVVESVVTTELPPQAFATMNMTNQEFNAAARVNDPRLGALPQRDVKATLAIQAEQSAGLLIDTIAGDLENGVMEPAVRKSWLNLLQFADDIPADEVVDAIGPNAAFTLSRMSPAQRFAMFASACKFRVYGLSSTLSRARDFQRIMALMQAVGTNPVLLQAFMQKFSGEKTLDTLIRALNINPESIQQTEQEQKELPDRLMMMQQLGQMLPAAGGSPPRQDGGKSDLDSERGQIGAENELQGAGE